MCPFCEWTPRGSDKPLDIQRRVHVLTCHRDRIKAAKVYAVAIAAGKTEREAQAAYNAIIYTPSLVGRYDRSAAADRRMARA